MPGETVYVPRLDLTGQVEDIDGDRVRIRKGSIAWTVERRDVARPAGDAGPQEGGRKMTESGRPPGEGGGEGMDEGEDEDEGRQTSYNTIDLRGRGLDEAQIDLDAFLDGAIEMGIETVYVIHGHGTGTLKNGLRRYVRHLKKVAGFRPGRQGEGGDGVTVCTLRAAE
jgi:DNA mismatch repair protein MutS2